MTDQHNEIEQEIREQIRRAKAPPRRTGGAKRMLTLVLVLLVVHAPVLQVPQSRRKDFSRNECRCSWHGLEPTVRKRVRRFAARRNTESCLRKA